MRMCSFVPVNIPILFGMLLSSPTPLNTIFWQVFNQSYNAGLNYGNRNASSPYTPSDLAKGYFAAVGSSITVALLLRKAFTNLTSKATGTRLTLLNAIVGATATGAASFLNTMCMRGSEMQRGIDCYADADLTEKIGTSKACATSAIY